MDNRELYLTMHFLNDFSVWRWPDFTSMGKIQNVRRIFFARELFNDIAFPYTSGSLYQKGSITLMLLLPFQQFIVYLPFHNSRIRLYCIVNISHIQDYYTRKVHFFLD